MYDEYEGFYTPIPSSNITIYTPWLKENDKYARFKRNYYITSIDTLDLFNAVIKKDYGYIYNNLTDFKEEKQITDKINENIENKIYCEASLHMKDKNDTFKYTESDLKNIIVTILDLILSLGIGSIIVHERDFKYVYEIKCVIKEYKSYCDEVTKTKIKLQNVKENIRKEQCYEK